ncbi:hypothetical protein JYB87_17870 [Shewanella avicenniae]|uniref:Adhesin n=1 Tax=Shewanella avicenniae TaxID=2814294 RepID=A0ABX7QRD6_9GAMM|nr:DUF4097 family beta strand repeat-containing protein [Shewanella avicenniae]QSX33550.1 hypothetical protein JYB87_17870 [Shewanella avicenniae]
MHNNTLLALSGAALLMAGWGFNAHALEHEHRSLVLDASQIKALHAETGAGDLRIIGVEGQKEIQVEADIYRSTDAEPELSLQLEQGKAHFVAQFNGNVSWGKSPYIDVVLTVPAEMTLSVDDGSGAIAIKNMHSDMKIDDGSGSLHIDGGNNLVILDGSGSIELRNISGNIALEDGSGSITIRDCAGDVKIDDGSGSIEVSQVAGKVTIHDGSGGISVTHANALNITESGSGEVSYRDIAGEVSVN